MPKKFWNKSKTIVFYGVELSFDSTESQLFSIIQKATRRMGFTKQYLIYKMALDAGHEVIRLPVAHCILNRIELAWAQVKGHIRANTSQFTLNEVECLAWDGFEVVTQEQWAGLVKHVRDKVEDHYWQND
uniref:Tc1-like transposase DDE domain-containing protein n=1 Tax=Amphimedon queenslandica TaxID=400682 RepID=A0A1X7VPT8_AMPQE